MNEEIEFIHDLSGSVSTLFILIDPVLNSLKSKNTATSEDLEQLQDAMQILDKMKTQIQDRRQKIREAQTRP